jgi:hypothetical protein
VPRQFFQQKTAGHFFGIGPGLAGFSTKKSSQNANLSREYREYIGFTRTTASRENLKSNISNYLQSPLIRLKPADLPDPGPEVRILQTFESSKTPPDHRTLPAAGPTEKYFLPRQKD